MCVFGTFDVPKRGSTPEPSARDFVQIIFFQSIRTTIGGVMRKAQEVPREGSAVNSRGEQYGIRRKGGSSSNRESNHER